MQFSVSRFDRRGPPTLGLLPDTRLSTSVGVSDTSLFHKRCGIRDAAVAEAVPDPVTAASGSVPLCSFSVSLFDRRGPPSLGFLPDTSLSTSVCVSDTSLFRMRRGIRDAAVASLRDFRFPEESTYRFLNRLFLRGFRLRGLLSLRRLLLLRRWCWNECVRSHLLFFPRHLNRFLRFFRLVFLLRIRLAGLRNFFRG